MGHFNLRMVCYGCGRTAYMIREKEDGEYAFWACGAVMRLPHGERRPLLKRECRYDKKGADVDSTDQDG